MHDGGLSRRVHYGVGCGVCCALHRRLCHGARERLCRRSRIGSCAALGCSREAARAGARAILALHWAAGCGGTGDIGLRVRRMRIRDMVRDGVRDMVRDVVRVSVRVMIRVACPEDGGGQGHRSSALSGRTGVDQWALEGQAVDRLDGHIEEGAGGLGGVQGTVRGRVGLRQGLEQDPWRWGVRVLEEGGGVGGLWWGGERMPWGFGGGLREHRGR